jgi:4-amino-4-deoxy-L-arabinose transferase-like glycosyltransferase
MTDRKRIGVLLFSGLAIAAIVLLAAGLSDLELQPGRPLARREQAEEALRLFSTEIPGADILGYAFVVLYYLAVLLLPFAIIYVIISPEARKRVLRSLGLLMWFIALFLVMRARPELFEELQVEPGGAPLPSGANLRLVEFAADYPSWAVPLATVGLAVLAAAAMVGVAWYVWRRSRPPAGSLEQLAREAQDAIDALQAGADVKDTVMRCYFEMSRVLREQRGIEREEAMTPRVFEASLKDAGLPDREVEQLTRLFESVRYGARPPGEQEEQQAIACLEAVVQACRGAS